MPLSLQQTQYGSRAVLRIGVHAVVTHHQKSSTVSNEYTARSVVPHVCDLVEPFGLSNHSVHLCSSGCFWPSSGSVLLGADASVALLGGAVAGWAASSDMFDQG